MWSACGYSSLPVIPEIREPACPARPVLLDLDGLLVDTEPLWYLAEKRVADELGWSYTPADHAAMLGWDLQRTAEYLRARSCLDTPAEDIGARLLDVLCAVAREHGVKLRPGAAALLSGLAAHGIPHALVTSSEPRFMFAVLAARGLEFEVTVHAGSTRRHKPDPAPYQLAAWSLGADPRDCIALEDSPAGAVSATSAGCQVIAVPSGPPVECPVVLRTLEELAVTEAGLQVVRLSLRP